MKRASSSFVLLFFAALMVSLNVFAQTSSTLTERVQQTLRLQERLRLADILRLSPQEQRQMEILSLTVMAQTFKGPGQLDVQLQGRSVGTLQVRRQLKEASLQLPQGLRLEGLELLASEEIFIESVTAQVRRLQAQPIPTPLPGPGPQPYPLPGPGPRPSPEVTQPAPQTLLTVNVQQEIRGQGEIPLKRLVLEQLGLTLDGAQIERVIVEGQPSRYGRAASVQIEMNSRLVSQEKYLAPDRARTPLPVQSMEEVQTLRLIVKGDAIIHQVNIRVGQVRQQIPRSQRILVQSEISSGRPLELGRLLPYENRSVRSLIIEARSRNYQAELALVTLRGEFLGSTIVTQSPMRPMIQLMRPVGVREILLQSISPVMIDTVELEFENIYPRY